MSGIGRRWDGVMTMHDLDRVRGVRGLFGRTAALLAAALVLVGVVAVPTPALAAGTAWSSVSVGQDMACGVRVDTSLWCWGLNDNGQLGDGTTQVRTAPVRIGLPTGWASVSTGGRSGCAVGTDGSLWCWGLNGNGQLGDGTLTTRATPVRIGTATTWRQVAVGVSHACAVRTDGSLWCWGAGPETGLALTTDVAVPTRVQPGTSWTQVSAGSRTSCGIRADGTLWCWGANTDGQTGTGAATGAPLLSPTRVGAATGWRSVSAGSLHGCAVRTDGSLWCWGSNTSGALGIGVAADQPVPVRVGTGTDWSVVSAGDDTSCALRAAGAVWCWGDNRSAQVGDGTTLARSVPTPVRVAATTWAAVSVGNDGSQSACGVTTDGTARCWGSNATGQQGTGSSNPAGTGAVAAPRRVAGGGTWRQVAAGETHACGIRTDGSLWCWGDPSDGRLGVPRGLPQYRPVRVGTAAWLQVATRGRHTCAVRADRTLWCWGYNRLGQLGDGTTTNRRAPVQVGTATWTAVGVGDDHTCGIRTEGSLWCWGWDGTGQLGDGGGFAQGPQPTPVRVGSAADWTSLAVGGDHTCAIQGGGAAGGSLSCWGFGTFGQLGNGGSGSLDAPTPVNPAGGWSSVGAGDVVTCGVRVDLTGACWGNDGSGELGDGPPQASQALPVTLPAPGPGLGWSAISPGNGTVCGTATDAGLWCWGANVYGQAGGPALQYLRPHRVGTATGWLAPSAGSSLSCAVGTGDAPFCWGRGELGQLGSLLPVGTPPVV